MEPVERHFFHANYHDLLNSLFSRGELTIFGQRMRVFNEERGGTVARGCHMIECPCLRHTTCLVAAVSVQAGSYPGRLATPFKDENGRLWFGGDVQNHFGMAITLDQEEKGQCEANLWLETDPRIWLQPRLLPGHVIDLEGAKRQCAKVPEWLPTFPGTLAIEHSKAVWLDIVGEWEAQAKAATHGERGMSKERLARANRFKSLKDKNPSWSYIRLANEANRLRPGARYSDDDVRNDYRAMGWKWEKAGKIR